MIFKQNLEQVRACHCLAFFVYRREGLAGWAWDRNAKQIGDPSNRSSMIRRLLTVYPVLIYISTFTSVQIFLVVSPWLVAAVSRAGKIE